MIVLRFPMAFQDLLGEFTSRSRMKSLDGGKIGRLDGERAKIEIICSL